MLTTDEIATRSASSKHKKVKANQNEIAGYILQVICAIVSVMIDEYDVWCHQKETDYGRIVNLLPRMVPLLLWTLLLA
jgi:hypothetical protein